MATSCPALFAPCSFSCISRCTAVTAIDNCKEPSFLITPLTEAKLSLVKQSSQFYTFYRLSKKKVVIHNGNCMERLVDLLLSSASINVTVTLYINTSGRGT